MKISDTKKEILNSATDRLLMKMLDEMKSPRVLGIIATANNKFSDLTIVGGILNKCYKPDEFEMIAYDLDVRIACSAIYGQKNDLHKTEFYKAAIGLRKICDADTTYLSSFDVQLNTIEVALPTGADIREALAHKLGAISVALTTAQNHTTLELKPQYVNKILSHEYMEELYKDEVLGKQV